VTREELQQTLWPADTCVDFEHGRASHRRKSAKKETAICAR
jgi:hypothetical protein